MPDQIAVNGKLMEVCILRLDSGFVFFTQNSQTDKLPLNHIDFIIIGFTPHLERYKKQDSLFAPYLVRADEAMEVLNSKPLSFKSDYRNHQNIVNNQFNYSPADYLVIVNENTRSYKRNLIAGSSLIIAGLTSSLLFGNTWNYIPTIFGTASGVVLLVKSNIKRKRAILYKKLAKGSEE